MYVITGATGHTGKRITENLLAAGQAVTVIGRSADRLTELVAKGAIAAAGNLTDTAFLAATFQGATAVYLMIPPPDRQVTDWRNSQREVIRAYVTALGKAQIRKVVMLSSMGAHLLEGAGPVSGLAELEQALRQVEGLDVLALRPGYFMENFFNSIGMIKHAGMYGSSLRPDLRFAVVHTRDIAEVATRRLLALDFSGHTYEYIGGAADLSPQEITQIVGQAIDQPDLPYVQFSPADYRAGLLQAGLPETMADGFLELENALNGPDYQADYVRTPAVTTPTTFAWFVENEWKQAF